MTDDIFQLKIVLRHSKPRIWRRIQIDPNILLADLHRIIQTSMGWSNSHLHQFMKDKLIFALPSKDDYAVPVIIDYRTVKTSALFKDPKDRMVYEYDFGDSWEHDIVLEKILRKDPKVKYPICIAGKMNCPPEDSGGVWGYAEMLKILKNRRHQEYQMYIDWLGGKFDPQRFDIQMINKQLQRKYFGCIEQ